MQNSEDCELKEYIRRPMHTSKTDPDNEETNTRWYELLEDKGGWWECQIKKEKT